MKELFYKYGPYRQLAASLGATGVRFLEFGLSGLTRILPHVTVSTWRVKETAGNTGVKWATVQRRELNLVLELTIRDPQGRAGRRFTLTATLTRLAVKRSTGTVQRTIDDTEHDIAQHLLERLAAVLRGKDAAPTSESLEAIQAAFDEQVVGTYLMEHHGLRTHVCAVFRSLRELAEQSYENKSLTFGCLLDPSRPQKPSAKGIFPTDVLGWKRYKALSDGYRTAYRISTNGCVVGFEDLRSVRLASSGGTHFFPEWCEYLAPASQGGICGVCLTRQGDILVFDRGTLRFTYRFGQWQYWNHTHVIDLLRNRAHVQRVPRRVIARVVSALYRAALDVSFRRSGGLFVLLGSVKQLRSIVLRGDAIGDGRRDPIHRTFDRTLRGPSILRTPRRLVVELAGLDGAVVLNNKGDILAYGAVLQPRKRGKVGPAEGSRTKAAIGASNYGLSVKISSDGDISFYESGEKYLTI